MSKPSPMDILTGGDKKPESGATNAAQDMAGNFMQKLGLSQPGSSEAANNDNFAGTQNAPAQRGQSLAI